MANPRMMGYDVAVGMVPATFVAVECVRTLPQPSKHALWIAAPVALAIVVLSRVPELGVMLMLCGSVAAAMVRLWWGDRGPQEV